jgi:RNA polymerase sigma factor
MAALSELSGVERKTLERHRRYLVAILLAYTNGFEIIRRHLGQLKGGTR